MSTSSTEPDDIDTSMVVRDLRQLLKDQNERLQALKDQNKQLQKDKSEAELNQLAQNTNSFYPFAANLSVPINAAAPMDAQQFTTLVTTLVSDMKSELLSQMETRLLAIFQQRSTNQSPTSPSLSATPSGSQVSNGQQGVFSSPGPTQPSHGLPASSSAGGSNNPTLRLPCSTSMTKPLKLISESSGIRN